MDVDDNWNGEDEPGLWVDWDDNDLKLPAICEAEEIPYELFDHWDPENDDDQNMTSVASIASQDSVLSGDPEPEDGEYSFSGAVHSTGRVGSRLDEEKVGNDISKGGVGMLPQSEQVGILSVRFVLLSLALLRVKICILFQDVDHNPPVTLAFYTQPDIELVINFSPLKIAAFGCCRQEEEDDTKKSEEGGKCGLQGTKDVWKRKFFPVKLINVYPFSFFF